MSQLVVASAASFETADLIHRLGERAIPVTNIVTGIGLTQSTIVASRLKSFVRGKDVIFCCTGGVIGPFNGVQVFSASAVRLAPFDVRRGDSELLGQFDPVCVLSGLDFGLSVCEAFGSLGISVGEERPSHEGHKLETLELYGVARAWLSEARSFTAIVASTNATGPCARVQWQENFKIAAAITAEALLPKLDQLVNGNRKSEIRN
jgi:hypothetical protein